MPLNLLKLYCLLNSHIFLQNELFSVYSFMNFVEMHNVIELFMAKYVKSCIVLFSASDSYERQYFFRFKKIKQPFIPLGLLIIKVDYAQLINVKRLTDCMCGFAVNADDDVIGFWIVRVPKVSQKLHAKPCMCSDCNRIRYKKNRWKKLFSRVTHLVLLKDANASYLGGGNRIQIDDFFPFTTWHPK